jgi:hypothetical protein
MNDQAEYNLLKRVRHRGIRVGHDSGGITWADHNEVYIDSWATNSYGILYYSGNADRPVASVRIRGNRVFGTGYHPIGIGSGYHAQDVEIENNYVQMQAQSPTAHRWPPGPGDPPGQLHPVNGFRFHKGPQDNVRLVSNTIVVKGRGTAAEPAYMRGLWLIPSISTLGVFEGNRIKQVAQNEHASGSAVAALGTDPDAEQDRIELVRNVIMASTNNVRFGDNYAHGGKYDLIENRYERIGNDPRYATIKLGWDGWDRSSHGHRFLDSEFGPGASHESVAFEGAGTARLGFTVLWSLWVGTDPGASISVQDVRGEEVEMYGGGTALRQYDRDAHGTTLYTPHRVTVDNRACDVMTRSVTMDRPRHLTMRCQGSTTSYLPVVLVRHTLDGVPCTIEATDHHGRDCRPERRVETRSSAGRPRRTPCR